MRKQSTQKRLRQTLPHENLHDLSHLTFTESGDCMDTKRTKAVSGAPGFHDVHGKLYGEFVSVLSRHEVSISPKNYIKANRLMAYGWTSKSKAPTTENEIDIYNFYVGDEFRKVYPIEVKNADRTKIRLIFDRAFKILQERDENTVEKFLLSVVSKVYRGVSVSKSQHAEQMHYNRLDLNSTNFSKRTSPQWIADEGEFFDRQGSFNPKAFNPAQVYIPKGKTFSLKSNPFNALEDPFDLKNLRFIPRDRPVKLLNEMSHAVSMGSKSIVGVINTGGTIAMAADPSSGDILRPTVNIEELLREAGGQISSRFDVSGFPHRSLIDSSQQEIDYVADLVIAMSWIYRNSSDELKRRFNGFLIPHGTDTIDTAAPYLAMMLGPDCPFSVGLIGAQRTKSDLFTDVGVNIRYAFDTLTLLKKPGEQVTTCFVYGGGTEGGAYRATAILKNSDRLTKFLDSPAHPRLIVPNDTSQQNVTAHFERAYQKREGFFRPIIMRGYDKSIVLSSRMGKDPYDYQSTIVNSDKPSVVFISFGSFTSNSKMLKAVSAACKASGKMFFATNPFPGGNTDQHYEQAQELRNSGACVVRMLPPALDAKIALAKTIWGAAETDKIYEFVASRDYIGEQIDWFDRDGRMLKGKNSLGSIDTFFEDIKVPRIPRS